MSMWRCPHCGTPQTESARCWVCRRSSTACGTCRHFRRSVAAQLGYCGLDRQRLPLRGDEIRACWEGRTGTVADDPAPPVVPAEPVHRLRFSSATPDDRTTVRKLEFVPVGEDDAPTPRRRAAQAPQSPPAAAPPPAATGAEPRWSLWGDLEP